MSGQAQERELAGRVALVTGATRGLGRAIAQALAEAGATVVVSSRKAEACEQVAEEITASTGTEAFPLALHVGDWDAIEPAVDGLVRDRGRIDVLVNNAGIAPLAPSAYDVGEALFDKTVDVNLKGPFRLMAVAGRHMQRAGSGSIVNISSIGADRPSPPEATYAATKSGLNALTRAFAQEYACRLLREHRPALDALAEALLKSETLDEQEILAATGLRPAPPLETRKLPNAEVLSSVLDAEAAADGS